MKMELYLLMLNFEGPQNRLIPSYANPEITFLCKGGGCRYCMLISEHFVHFSGKTCSLRAKEAAASARAAYAGCIHYATVVLYQCVSSTTAKDQKGVKWGMFTLVFAIQKTRGSLRP